MSRVAIVLLLWGKRVMRDIEPMKGLPISGKVFISVLRRGCKEVY